MTNKTTSVMGIIVLIITLALSLPAISQGEGESAIARVQQAAGYLMRAQLGDGLFRYEHDFLSGRDSKKNNIVRQAGTTYALAEYLAHFPGPAAEVALKRAQHALAAASMSWGDGSLVTVDGKAGKAKAGATALALLSLLMQPEPPGAADEAVAAAWLKGLLALQMANGGFASRPDSKQQSAYSNGEIWLALARYNAHYPQQAAAAEALRRADDFMMEFYSAQPQIGFFHWGVMAASTRYASTREPRFIDFIVQQVSVFLDHLRPQVKTSSNSCYSVEGLLDGAAAIRAHGGHRALLARIMVRVRQEMAKNRRLQILPGQQQIVFGEERMLAAPEIAEYSGAFLNGRYRPQARIDATQHCLSAMLKVLSTDG